MPQQIDVKGVGVVEFPDETKPEEIQKVLDESFGKKGPTVSAGGAFARSIVDSAPAGLGAAILSGAALSEVNPIAHVWPPFSEIGFAIGGGVVGAKAFDWGKEKIAEATIPEKYKEFKELRQVDQEQQFLPSAAGEFVGNALTFRPSLETPKGLYQIARAATGGVLKKAEKEAAVAASVQLGLAGATSTIIPLTEGETPTLKGVAKEAAIMSLLGHSHWKGLRPGSGIQRNEGPAATPEVMAQRADILKQKAAESGKPWTMVQGDLPGGNATDVAHAMPDGSVVVSEKNFNEWLDRDVPKGYDHTKAIENLVNHETVHGVTPDDLAAEFEKSLTSFQKWNYRRRYHGPTYSGANKISGVNLGKEALRYEVQLASEMEPSEYIAHTQEARATKFLTVLDKAADFFRSNARTAAQKAMVERLKTNVEAAKDAAKKGATDASSKPEAAEVHGDVQPQPIKGEGEVPVKEGGAGVQPQAAPVAEETQIPLAEGMTGPLKQAAYRDPKTGKVFYGIHHPEALMKAGGQELVDKYSDRESRNTKDFGYVAIKDGKQVFVPRDQAGPIAKNWKQDLTEFDVDEKGAEIPHSDEVAAQPGGETAISEEAPPAAPTGEAQPTAPETGKGKPGVAAPVEPATPSISPAFDAVKMREFEALDKEIADPSFKYNKEKYDRWIKLSEEREAAMSGSGIKAQAGATAAMSRKEVPETIPGDRVVTLEQKNPDGSVTHVVGSYNPAKSYDLTSIGKGVIPQTGRVVENGWSHGLLRPNERIIDDGGAMALGETAPSAMSRKGQPEPMSEEDVARGIVSAIGGTGGDPQKIELVKGALSAITKLPKEHWGPALTDFHFAWKAQELAEAHKEIDSKQAQREAISKQTGVPVESLKAGEELAANIDPANIQAKLGLADRQGIYRSALYILNKTIKPVIAESASGRPRVLPAEGQPKNEAVRPDYYVGDHAEFMQDIQEKYPHIPEWAANEIWTDSVNDFLNNASGEKLTELLRPARLEKRFLGNDPAPQTGESATEYQRTDLRRAIPDADPRPILADMAKAPDPSQVYKFKKFCAARDLTPEQGIQELNRLNENITEELRAAVAKKIKTKTGDEVLEAGREELSAGDERDLDANIKRGRALNQKRRAGAIAALREWYTKPLEVTKAANPLRNTIGIEDIWFETKRGNGAYAEYGTQQGEDAKFLKGQLGQWGSVKGKTATTTRSIAVVVDRETGDYHAVSVYVRDGQPMVYDPDVYAGSKEGGHIPLSQLLTRYRVAASMLVRDPVYNFHQKWMTEKGGKTGEQKYNEAIGEFAKVTENATQDQYAEYLQRIEDEKAAAEREQFEQRFEAEEEPATEGEEKPTLSIRDQRAAQRKAEGLATWADVNDPDALPSRKKQTPEDRASIEAWLKGPGSGKLGLFQTDLRTLVNPHLNGSEAEALYEVLSSLKMSKGPGDLFELIQHFEGMAEVLKNRGLTKTRLNGRDISALYGMHKIANRVYETMRNSPYEKNKLAGLPEIPKDTEYSDMSPGEKEHFAANESLKYRALLRSLKEIYEIANEARNAPGRKGPAAEGLAVSPESEAFRTRALDKYGDTARRDVQSAAVSQERTSGREVAYEPRMPRGSKLPIPLQGGVTAGKRFPRAVLPPEMLPPGSAQYQEAPLPTGFRQPYEGAQPKEGLPITGPPSNIQPGDFIRQKYGKPQYTKGFAPLGPSRHELLTGKPLGTDMHAAMTRKGYGPADRYQDELRAQGRTTYTKEKTEKMSKEDLIAGGRELVSSRAINPVMERRQFERTEAAKPNGGYMSINSVLAWRYWGYRLQGMADAIANDPKLGMNSPEFKEISARSAEWTKFLDASAKRQFALIGHGLQGWNQIGPDDMKSTQFVREYLKKVKAKEKKIDPEDYEFTEEDEADIQHIVKQTKQADDAVSMLSMAAGEEFSKAQDPALDAGQKKLAGGFDALRKTLRENAAKRLKSGKPGAAMAMKGKEGELPPLDRDTEDILGNLGMDVMSELSKANGLTDASWIAEMKKVLSSDEVQRPDLEPYLPHIRAVSEAVRDAALNNYIGTGSATGDVRKIFTRKRPPIEESLLAIRRALESDPTGRDITPAEAFHVWNYLKSRFFDKGVTDFREIRLKASAELGIKDELLDVVTTPYTQLRLFRAISATKSMRVVTEELMKKMRDETRIKSQAANWLKNQQYPGWLRTARMFPRFFFLDKILGHGLVPMITHAPTMLFNPKAWSEYFGKFDNGKWKPGAWQQMYRMTKGENFLGRHLLGSEKGRTAEDYHADLMEELTSHENFEAWKSVDLACDPLKYSDDYQIEGLQNMFNKEGMGATGKKGGIGYRALRKLGVGENSKLIKTGQSVIDSTLAGRGFDALKTLRFAMAEKWLKSLPEHLQNKESMRLIADSVNHATGIVKTSFHESANWAMFAPKLEASRWAYLIKDTAKAADILRKGSSSMEERAWAKSELKQKALVIGMYYGMLQLNQAFLSMTGDKQEINMTDPKKSDFLAFKVAGFKAGVISPFVGMIRLFSNLTHASTGKRSNIEKLDSRQKQIGKTVWEYGRGKMSPLASFSTDIATGEDYSRRPIPVPWAERPSRRARLRGVSEYETGEYLAETFSPIPVQEALKETWRSMGMEESDSKKLSRILAIAGTMAATGARVSTDE